MKVSNKAILVALVVFTILHMLLLVAARNLLTTPDRVAMVVPILNAAAYLIYLVTGLIAGGGAKNAPVLHGVAAGFFAAIIAIIFFGSTKGDLLAVAVLIANGLIFGGIGGACSLLFAKEPPTDA